MAREVRRAGRTTSGGDPARRFGIDALRWIRLKTSRSRRPTHSRTGSSKYLSVGDMKRHCSWLWITCWIVFSGLSALAEGPAAGIVKPLRSVTFRSDTDVKCLDSAIESGDATTGPSTWILKAPTGCVVPWHSHTAEEQLMVVDGQVLVEMTDRPSTRLSAGGFAMMGSHMTHQFSCRGPTMCLMFVTFDRIYDIKWGKGD